MQRYSTAKEPALSLGFYRVYRCSDDRFVAVGALKAPFFQQLVNLTGLEAELSVEQQYNPQQWPAMERSFSHTFLQRTRDEWSQAALALDCCLTPVLNFTEAMHASQNVDNGWINQDPFAHPGTVLDFSN